MKRTPVLVLSALLLLGAAACSKSAPPEGAAGNDLRVLPGAGAGRGGVIDDGVKPVVGAPVPVKPVAPLPVKPVAKGGIPDDSIKPVAKGGVPDDGVKPMPAQPVPTR
ncbi:MAG TPA: hypothetical protein VLT33_45060 [Labilithrix sp.]|nr:hypothetical protein [Labilithrix sp.]